MPTVDLRIGLRNRVRIEQIVHAGGMPPLLWGTEPRLVELSGPQAADIRVTRRYLMPLAQPNPRARMIWGHTP